jgi:tRNA pseudouridine38-40 synthase
MTDVAEPALPAGEGGLSRAAAHAAPEGLVRVRLDVAYDGTAYSGWARQRDRPSVQGVLEDALSTLGAPARLTVAGRTDAGVHARGQVAHADLPPSVAGDPLLRRKLNGLLPLDVRVRAASAAPPGFDARFSAVARTYRYRTADRPEVVDPLQRTSVYVVPRPLDLDALRAACPPMLGVHDFAAFCRRREGATTVRGLLALDWARDVDGLLVMTIEADAFCHSMVRSVVGAMLAVGEGRRPPEWPASLLGMTGRATDVAVAPPHGLVLEAVTYPPDDELLARQGITRNLRG